MKRFTPTINHGSHSRNNMVIDQHFESKEPHIAGKAHAQILLKFGGHSKHQSGFVSHGNTKEPATRVQPCEAGMRVGTKHVHDVKFGMPTSEQKLLSLARKEHKKGKAYLYQSPPNKSLAHKHLSRAHQCISTVYLVR